MLFPFLTSSCRLPCVKSFRFPEITPQKIAYSVAYWFSGDHSYMVGNATIADDACGLLTCAQCAQNKNGCASTRLARAPWRAPGTAILDGGPCGTIGWDGAVGRDPSITNGADLPPVTPAPVWTVGGVQKVAWGLAVNHGGGYSYRLCRRPGNASTPLTEECFQKTPLEFVGNSTDIVDSRGKTLHTIPAARTKVGTTPAGSEWTRNPVPDQPRDPSFPPNFPPPLPGFSGHCCDEGCPEGCGDGFGQAWSLMDKVKVPDHLEPGDYVLGWRWDCEELTQVWTNCADVQLRAASKDSQATTKAVS